MTTQEALEVTNLHWNWRRFHLDHIRQVRSFMNSPWNRSRRGDYRRAIKKAQREAAAARALFMAARMETKS